MRHRNSYSLVLSLCLMLGWQAAPARGQVPGSDGALNVTADMEIDLCNAMTGDAVLTPGTGNGVYDAARWVVVFHYTSINIAPLTTVTFKNHPKGAPVVWFASLGVTIQGSVELNGAAGSQDPLFPYAIPGPGGFSGGIGRLGGSAGFGPGGGGFGNNGGGGSYGTLGDGGAGVIYGTDSILPLIGGSGGGADSNSVRAGGAGGGAILIVSSGDILLPDAAGGIFANGGNGFDCCGGSGSGGGIRLIANGIISGPGMLQALGGTAIGPTVGGHGRIRLEVPNPLTDIQLTSTPMPQESRSTPGLDFPAATVEALPTLRVTAVHGKPVTADPSANVLTSEVAIGADFPVTVDIELLNMPQAAGMTVNVRAARATGGFSQTVQSMPLVDDGTGMQRLTATAVFDFSSPGNWEVQLSLPLP